MPEDPLQQILRLVADGRLTAAEAAPIVNALDAGQHSTEGDPATSPAAAPDRGRPAAPRYARVEVVERGRRAVDLRIPLSLGRRAIGSIPGLSSAQVVELADAVGRGLTGPIVDIADEDGDGVRIVLE